MIKNAILIKKSRDRNGNQTLYAKMTWNNSSHKGVRRQRNGHLYLEEDIRELIKEFYLKNDIDLKYENHIYQISENQFIASIN